MQCAVVRFYARPPETYCTCPRSEADPEGRRSACKVFSLNESQPLVSKLERQLQAIHRADQSLAQWCPPVGISVTRWRAKYDLKIRHIKMLRNSKLWKKYNRKFRAPPLVWRWVLDDATASCHVSGTGVRERVELIATLIDHALSEHALNALSYMTSAHHTILLSADTPVNLVGSASTGVGDRSFSADGPWFCSNLLTAECRPDL